MEPMQAMMPKGEQLGDLKIIDAFMKLVFILNLEGFFSLNLSTSFNVPSYNFYRKLKI